MESGRKIMDKINVVVTFNLIEPYREKLIEICGERCNLLFAEPGADAGRNIEEAEVILGSVPADASLFSRAKKLKWMQSQSAGVEDLTGIFKELPAAVLTNASGAYGQGISEYLIAYALFFLKKLRPYDRGQDERAWRSSGRVNTIDGADVTVVGLGNLGGTFARKMHLLGARVRGVKRVQAEKPDYLDEQFASGGLDEALAGADIVAFCLPETRETKGIMSRERIFAMKKDAILLNAGRGSAIDQQALYDALAEKRIYAGLDVTTPEPLPEDNPLWGCENLLITPHISGGPSSAFAPGFISGLMVRNMEAYLNGGALENVVDLELGY